MSFICIIFLQLLQKLTVTSSYINFYGVHYSFIIDFQEDAPVPVNSKRLPGYYEPACIILGGSHKTLDSEAFSNSTNVENSGDDNTPKYFVLEKQSEE